MIYDLDAAFGGDCSAPSVNFNVLDDALNPAHGSYTQILRNLILNDSFKVFFINRFADLLNSNFLSSKLNSSVQNVKNVYDPEMMRYVNRWRYPSDSTTLAGRLFEVPSLNKWNSISNYLTSFALNRPAKTRNQFNNYFTLNDTVKITINVNDTVMGKIKLNSLYLDKDLNRDSAKIYPWSGIYFKGNPITVTAIPYPGYKFKNWGQATDTNAQKTVLITSGSTITAYFEQDTAFDPLQFLFINEILPHNNYSIFDEFVEHDGWIEIYNPNSFAVDLKDFFITDDLNNKTKFRINERSQTSIIPAKKHFILWADKDTLQGKLHLNFQLNSGGGELYLIAPNGFSLVDSVIYTSVKADVSVGRSSDGNNEWKEFVIPTPNETNRTIDNPEPEKLFIWPNPAQNNETITLSRKTDITIYDVCGKIIRQEMNVKYIDLAGFPKGLYFIHPAAGATQKLIVY